MTEMVDRDTSPMLADIRRQPDVIEGIAARAKEIVGFADAHLRPVGGGRLVAFGSGDGWFAARATTARAANFSASSGLEMLAFTAPTMEPDDRALAISMSGNVDRSVEAAQAAIERDVPSAALVNGTGGRLAALGLPTLSLDLEDIAPFLCGTSSYLATLSVLRILSAAKAEVARIVDTLRLTARALPAFLAQADAVAAEVATALAPRPRGVRLLSAGGAGLAIADYGAAKLVELTRTPSWTDDIEEFAHRQFWSADAGELVVFLPTTPLVAEYADRSAEALAEMGFATLAIGPRPWLGSHARWSIPIDDADADPLISDAIALQLLAYRLAEAEGLNPNRRQHLKDDILRFRVSRMLTRRSLVGTGQ